MSKKKAHHEEHVDETWLIPYADMLTLLLALFIVMFAMGQTDKEKFEQMKEQFSVIFSGGSGILEGEGTSFFPMEKTGTSETSESPGPTKSDTPGAQRSNTVIEDDKMKEIKEILENQIAKEGYTDKIKTVLNKEGLEISIQDTVLFESGDANVLNKIMPLLLVVSKVLQDTDNNIKIVGHTDNVPISTGKFRSNWDLSAIRAINVMQFLVDRGGLRPERFTIQGNGEYLPKYDNATENGRAQNRRVEIFIVRKYPLNQVQTKEAPKKN
ncbi:MAG: OmpA family protein [Clostridia bacterium]|nr:OmpA family protein [Clostridia bacterium]